MAAKSGKSATKPVNKNAIYGSSSFLKTAVDAYQKATGKSSSGKKKK